MALESLEPANAAPDQHQTGRGLVTRLRLSRACVRTLGFAAVASCATASPGARAQEWPSFGPNTSTLDRPVRNGPTMTLPWQTALPRVDIPAPVPPPAAIRPAPSKAIAVADPAWTAKISYEPSAPGPRSRFIPSNVEVPRAARAAPLNPIVPKGHLLEGIASYYWQDQMTSSGERFNRSAFTAAHKTLPMNSRVMVTNVVNGRSIIVRINDRGPFKPGRVIDLSEAAAQEIGMHDKGLVPVKIQVLSK